MTVFPFGPCFETRRLLCSPQDLSDISGFSMARIILRLRNEFTCKDCGGHSGIRSRKRTWEYLLPLVLLHPVRCADCFRRSYCLVFVPLIPANDAAGSAAQATHSFPNDHRAA